ncbi:MAG: hypothetical protein JYX80_12325 [Candidatus Scalindua sediminis]|nr:hypothetical protein [Candidatus Scalindua sediminis]
MHCDTCQKYAVKVETEFAPIVRDGKSIKSLINAFDENAAKLDLISLQTVGTVG